MPEIKNDERLIKRGKAKLRWVKEFMPILNVIEKEFYHNKPFKNIRIAICLHLEAKTGYLAEVLKAGGADVTITASNPLSTQDDVVAALMDNGIRANARHGVSDEEYTLHHCQTILQRPQLIIDDGGDLITLMHTKFRDYLPEVIGGCEETTTGLQRLRSMERTGNLAIPVIAVNDALMKYLFDNRYGTGQSVWESIMHTTNLSIAGKNVVVVGYGWCGKGIAMRAKGLGAKVTVNEIDPVKANEALMDGFDVMSIYEASKIGNIFVTATGNYHVINKEHFDQMPNGAILANAGHFDVEINKEDLNALAIYKGEIKEHIGEYQKPDGKKIYLLAEGRLVNLASGNGHPAEIMDISFAIQALSLQYILQNKNIMEKGVSTVPKEIDYKVAMLRLAALDIKIDDLNELQRKYLESWKNK